MNKIEATRTVESLREGIPPEKHISLLTVGRSDEINKLRQILSSNQPQTYLIKANWGCGKTHLLKFIKEEASKISYVTSLITIMS